MNTEVMTLGQVIEYLSEIEEDPKRNTYLISTIPTVGQDEIFITTQASELSLSIELGLCGFSYETTIGAFIDEDGDLFIGTAIPNETN